VVVLSGHVEVEHAMDLLASGQRPAFRVAGIIKSRLPSVACWDESADMIESALPGL
jgi:hypothetical protein